MEPEKETERKVVSLNFKKILSVLGIVISLSGFIVAGIFIKKYSDVQKQLKNPSEVSQKEAEKLVGAVSKLMVLPDNEKPQIADVTDIEKLKEQPFFAKAANGDKVLIFTDNKLAILYRPKDKKIINVGGLNTEGNPVAKPKLTILNGTQTPGLATDTESKLKVTFPDYQVIKKADAAVKTREKTIVVDVNGKYPTEATKLAENLKGEVGVLPQGEAVPTTDPATDILIILGSPLTTPSPTP